MDVERGYLLVAGGVATAAVIAGIWASTADASSSQQTTADRGRGVTCPSGYSAERIKDYTFPDGRVATVEMCAKVTGHVTASTSATPTPAAVPVTSRSPAASKATPTGRPRSSRPTVTVVRSVTRPRTTVTVTKKAPTVTVTAPPSAG